jgi:DNA-binding CsgD family transcriptional regulator
VIVGRGSQRAELAAFLDGIRTRPAAAVLQGEPGIGKSVLWAMGVDEARDRGFRVLSCRPTGSDSELSFVALGDLFDAEMEPYLPALPTPQREALEAALLRTTRGHGPPDPRAIAVASLGVLHAISTDAATIVAIDDVQWIDPATARVLSFAARRLSDERIGFLLGRPETDEPIPLGLTHALPPERLIVVTVGPLAPSEIAAIVRERTGRSLSRLEVGKLAELSGGNPFYALEIARARARGEEGVTGQRLPIPKGLRDDLIRNRVGDVGSRTRDVLLFAAAMARPNVDALRSLVPDLDPSLQQAIDAGIIEVRGLEVRFVHPLYRSAIYADASRRRRHQVHGRLAEVTVDPEERARHLALSADGADAAVADAVEQAATSARERGAPDVSAELLDHALRLTPHGDLPATRRRLLHAAKDRIAAGDADGARARAREALRIPGSHLERAESLHLIASIEIARRRLAEARVTLDEALELAGSSDALRAKIHRDLARVALDAGEIAAAKRHADAVLELTTRIAEVDVAQAARTTAADVDVLLARASPNLSALEEARDPGGNVADSPQVVLARADMLSGRLEEAGRRLERLLIVALERGDEPGRRLITSRLAEVQVRSGAWESAAELSREARDLALGLSLNDALELGLMAYSAAGLGRAEDARALAEQGLGLAGSDRPALLWNLSALGFLEVSLGQLPEALRYLSRAGGVLAATGVVDPCAFPFLGDEAEAQIAAGDPETAARRIDALEEVGQRLDRQLILGQAARCRGLADAARGDIRAALPNLERAVAHHERVGIPVELGRSMLALGATRRRDRQKRPAREVLERALDLFASSGSPLWADRAREELARIGGRRAAAGELTETEERVARLAAAGMTNREIAKTLFVGVRTVEGHLSHVYAKLGIRSRTELALFFQPSE